MRESDKVCDEAENRMRRVNEMKWLLWDAPCQQTREAPTWGTRILPSAKVAAGK